MKLEYILSDVYAVKSPPSRGAWIEMPVMSSTWMSNFVAPLAGGVD